jgi:DNA-directed RNA polymerase subunit M/transcription elongation factor TFIIS
MNKFFFIWNCGDVLSLDAIKNLNMKNKCLLCGQEFKKEDLISLNYSKEEKEKIKKKILLEKKEKSLMLQLKRKREENKKNENEIIDNNNENTIIKKIKLI